jgi:hypothetical protein
VQGFWIQVGIKSSTSPAEVEAVKLIKSEMYLLLNPFLNVGRLGDQPMAEKGTDDVVTPRMG